MDVVELSKGYVPKESVDAAMDFVADFAPRMSEFKGRLTGSEQETACARAIRSRLADETDVNARLEAFRAAPRLGRASFPMIGLWLLICYILYYVSFAGDRAAQIALTAVALVAFIAGNAVLVPLFLSDKRAGKILKKKVSYNVVSEFSKSDMEVGKQRVIIIADNHDAPVGSVLNAKLRRLTAVFAPISAAVFVLFCVIKMAVGADTPAKISTLAILPALLGGAGVALNIMRYSPLARHAEQPNDFNVCVAMATYAYFAEQPELMPSDARIVYASFGGENSGHSGSTAFIKAHPEFLGAYVLSLGDIGGDSPKIAEYDPLRRRMFSTSVTSAISAAAHEQGVAISTVPHATFAQKLANLHGFTAGTFSKEGVASAAIVGIGDSPANDDTIKQMFALSVSTVFKLFKEIPQKKEDAPADIPAAALEFKSIFSK